MDQLVTVFWLIYGVGALVGWHGHRNNPFGLAKMLIPIGAFVWGDGLVIGLFWVITTLLMLVIGRTDLFGMVWLVFWWVRALGEIIYWLNEQFATKHRNKPEDLWGHELMRGETIYFGYQLFWQMVMVGTSMGILWRLGVLA